MDRLASTREGIQIYKSLAADEMVKVMQLCSYAICSPSTIVYEYMSVGGVVFLEQIADNQKDVINYFTKQGFAFRLDRINSLNADEIQFSLARQAEFFDGRSGERLKKIFRQYFETEQFSIRKVTEGDISLCFGAAGC